MPNLNGHSSEARERLMDAAEQVFTENGLAGCSVRAITKRAGANLAAVGYHFGSKEALLQATVARRFAWLTRRRRDSLETIRQGALPGLPTLEAVVDAMILPMLNAAPDQPEESARIRSFISRVISEGPAFMKSIPVDGAQEMVDQFLELVHALLPELSLEDLYWRAHFSAGPILGTLTHGDRLRAISRGSCDPDNIHEAATRLRSFICAGLRAEPSLNRQSA